MYFYTTKISKKGKIRIPKEYVEEILDIQNGDNKLDCVLTENDDGTYSILLKVKVNN